MSDKSKIPDWDDDEELSRLLAESNQICDDSYMRPNNETIQAYLLGTANKLQTDEIRVALLHSSDFRKEIAILTEELSRLDVAGLRKASDSESTEAIPDLSYLMSGARATNAPKSQLTSRTRRIVEVIFRPRWVAAFALVIIVIVGTMVLQQDPISLGHMSLVRQTVELDELIRFSPREIADQIEEVTFNSAEHAAIAAFRSNLTYNSGLFAVDSIALRDATPKGDQTVMIRLKYDNEGVVEISGKVPDGAFGDEGSVSVWLLRLHDRALYMVEMPTPELEVSSIKNTTGGLLIAFVCRAKGSYRASGVRVL